MKLSSSKKIIKGAKVLKELSWYIETNRFSNIVEKIEEKATAYSEALKADSDNKDELREDLRAYCQWHMEKSGYKTESVPYINMDMEFFISDIQENKR